MVKEHQQTVAVLQNQSSEMLTDIEALKNDSQGRKSKILNIIVLLTFIFWLKHIMRDILAKLFFYLGQILSSRIAEVESKFRTGGVIDSTFSYLCTAIDTSSNHCCYNSKTLKLFCHSNQLTAEILGIDTSTPGVCDSDAVPCN